jgi:hypothetical protein
MLHGEATLERAKLRAFTDLALVAVDGARPISRFEYPGDKQPEHLALACRDLLGSGRHRAARHDPHVAGYRDRSLAPTR